MRRYIVIFLLTFFNLACFGQNQRIDSLINQISNSQIGIMRQYVWYPKMISAAGDTLITIGKPATKQLVAVLGDTCKGIIANHILSCIWNREIGEFARKDFREPQFTYNPDSPLAFFWDGLIFYLNAKSQIFSKENELIDNKIFWVHMLAKLNNE